ncbi:hypothetical protein KP509_11G009500 [Ceratopteris richardii]|nr:hypothetical protein KP509_11G009500 [Ceratopteris richardii]
MKWTDAMVKLLIQVVILVGEDGTNEVVDCNKKKTGFLQKKGKWKSVSRVMNEKGCYVSPQQCEDKFNDLNKRYKRLNDILGKGIACCVVEDPSLLDSMDNVPAKSKEDVRKILSSKQLFYKEICAYHNGCKSVLPVDFELQRSVHSGNMCQNPEYMDIGRQHSGLDCGHDDDEEEDDDDIDKDDDDDDDSDDHDASHPQTDTVNGINAPFARQKTPIKQSDRISSPFLKYSMAFAADPPLSMDQIMMAQDGTKRTAEQQHSIQASILQLEEQKVGLLAQALELERQRFKWERLNSKRSRELEQLRLDNKKMKLENERISLSLKQKELEAEYKRSEASMSSIDLILERFHSKEPSNLVSGQSIGQQNVEI